jgi:hypothetical protein
MAKSSGMVDKEVDDALCCIDDIVAKSLAAHLIMIKAHKRATTSVTLILYQDMPYMISVTVLAPQKPTKTPMAKKYSARRAMRRLSASPQDIQPSVKAMYAARLVADDQTRLYPKTVQAFMMGQLKMRYLKPPTEKPEPKRQPSKTIKTRASRERLLHPSLRSVVVVVVVVVVAVSLSNMSVDVWQPLLRRGSLKTADADDAFAAPSWSCS